MQIQEAGARSTAQVLVAAADREIRIERCDVDREHAERMVDIDAVRAHRRRVPRRRSARQFRQHLPGIEHDLRKHDQVGAGPNRRQQIFRGKMTAVARLDEAQRDAAAPRVLRAE